MRDQQLITGPRAVTSEGRQVMVVYCTLYCTVLYCTAQVLVVRDLAPEDAGRYECVASNIGGSVTRFQEVRLKVPSPPPSVYR